MMASVEIDRASRRKMEEVLNEFAKRTGKHVEDGINEVAKSAARRLVHTVQPYGMNAGKGAKFQSSIGGQVYRAAQNANVTGRPGNAAEVHRAARDSRGQVPKELTTQGRFKRDPVEIAQREEQARRQKSKAGRAKGAWVEAANDIGGAKMSGVAQWIERHNTGGYGEAVKSGSAMKYTVELKNRTPYLRSIQTGKAIAQAAAFGLKNGFKRIVKITEKEIEKANRAQ